MEHIKQALDKSGNTSEPVAPAKPAFTNPAPVVTPKADTFKSAPVDTTTWAPRKIELKKRLLERNRIVSHLMRDPSHIAFNLLRTRIRRVMAENKWQSLAITSPTEACGKTLIASNLAFSFARAVEGTVVLMDLDLKRPSIASTLGITAEGTIGDFLKGECEAKDCFVQVADNLVIGLGGHPLRESSELIQSQRMSEMLRFVQNAFSPELVIYDLPPMQASDDALAFLPLVDTAILVAAAGTSKSQDLDDCEQQIHQLGKMLGVVLNKAESTQDEYYY